MALVTTVVVSYNSRGELRACVERLTPVDDFEVIVVDNASADDSPAAVADLPVSVVRLSENRGFAYGCNIGWKQAQAPFVLFLNPDASVDETSVRRLVAVAQDSRVGAVAPRIVGSDGALEYSLRRFPRLRTTFAQALFVHRLLPRAAWTDESVRDRETYERPGTPEWVSGACVLVRREAMEAIGGLDEGFFMYSEDTDLCRSLRDAGYEIRFEPTAVCVHHGGRSAPRAELLPLLAASRWRYARKHHSAGTAFLQRVGMALGALTHMLFSTQGRAMRAGHAAALSVLLSKGTRPSRVGRAEVTKNT
jgi:GT2 family glycosyltransferase